MGLVDLLLQSGGGDLLGQVAKKAGTDQNGAEDLLKNLGSAMFGQVKGRVESPSLDSTGLEDLIGNSKYADMLDQPSSHYNDNQMEEKGNDLLSYITGSREGSREVASQVSEKTGFDSSIIKSLLPMLAPLIIGSLGKGMLGGGSSGSSLNNVPSNSGNAGGGLMNMLDFDNDGSVIDDVAGLAMKFLR
ncbi:MAG: DUF937 domain-containing protein [Epsilonproteobacteria bacterium]|nr:DUF937 domain-containing protein [Campylobacterota bacterium]